MIDIQNMIRNRGQLNLFDGKGAPVTDWLQAVRQCRQLTQKKWHALYLQDWDASIHQRMAIDPAAPDADRTIYGNSTDMVIVDDIEKPCSCDNCSCPETRLCMCQCPKHRR